MVGKWIGDFSNGWKNGAGFFQSLEKAGGFFPMVGKTGVVGAGRGVRGCGGWSWMGRILHFGVVLTINSHKMWWCLR